MCSICGERRSLSKQEAQSLAASPNQGLAGQERPAQVQPQQPSYPEQTSYPQQSTPQEGGTQGFPQYPRQPQQDNPWQQG